MSLKCNGTIIKFIYLSEKHKNKQHKIFYLKIHKILFNLSVYMIKLLLLTTFQD